MLRIRSSLIVVAAMSVLATLHTSPARADTWDELTYFTFSAPVEIPGAALPAGTYLFRLADPAGSRSVVQVLSKDGSQVYSTFFAIPDERPTPTDQPMVTFAETPIGVPEIIKAWFYPGDTAGHKFVYPKQQAATTAATTHEAVFSSGRPSL
jgi:hypothetical protein